MKEHAKIKKHNPPTKAPQNAHRPNPNVSGGPNHAAKKESIGFKRSGHDAEAL